MREETHRPSTVRRLGGWFRIGGCDIWCAFQRHEAPPAGADWWRRWRQLTTACPFTHIQQAGDRPTFLCIAADQADTGRALAHELICGGWFWPRLARRHHLFRLQGDRVDVFTGERVRPDYALAQQAGTSVLPLALESWRRQADASARRDAAWSAVRTRPWRDLLPDLGTAPPPPAAAVLGGRTAGLLVIGEMEQTEAEALGNELVQTGRWQPGVHGSTVVECRARGIAVTCEHPGRGADLREVAEGFSEWVVASDLHLGLPWRDTFGPAKARAFCGLLDRAIERRSVLVLNGDFMELLHERYGAIKRAYPEIFARLPRLRRIVYVAGNHDAEVLADRIKQTRRSVRAVAWRHTYAEVRLGFDGGCWLERKPGSGGLRHARAWAALLRDARVRRALADLLKHRQGRVFLSHGFARQGVAFKRLGPRDTAEEQPQWFLDDSVALEPDAADRLLKLLADRRQRLDRVLMADWGGRVEIVRHLWNPARGLFFEHGHAAIPACSPGGVGWLVSTAAGWLKRCGLRRIEHWFEEDLGDFLRAIHPFGSVRETRRITERLLAVAAWLRAAHPGAEAPWLICGHTHETAVAAGGVVHAFLAAAQGARYANSGAWSSRFRLRRPAANRGEWLMIAADNSVRVGATVSEAPAAGPVRPRVRPTGPVPETAWLPVLNGPARSEAPLSPQV